MQVIDSRNKVLARNVLVVIAVMLLAGLVAGTFLDWTITSTLYMPSQPIAQIVTAFGLLPLTVPLCIILGAICQRVLGGSQPIALKALLCVVAVALGGYASVVSSRHILDIDGIGPLFPFEIPSIVGIVLGVVLFVALFAIGYRAAITNDEPELLRRLLMVVLLMLLAYGMVEILKHVMHRPRFRAIVQGYQDVVFYPWYKPFHGASELAQTYGLSSDSFKSFPSGHSCQAGIALVAFYGLASLFPSLRTKWGLAIATQVILLLLIMASRLILGAHFLSDVSVGACLSVLAGILLYTRRDLN